MARFLRFKQLKTEKSIPFSRMHVDRLEKAGKFPKRVRLGEHTVAWVEEEIDAMQAAQLAARDAAAA
jgi:prophage regulatory protein